MSTDATKEERARIGDSAEFTRDGVHRARIALLTFAVSSTLDREALVAFGRVEAFLVEARRAAPVARCGPAELRACAAGVELLAAAKLAWSALGVVPAQQWTQGQVEAFDALTRAIQLATTGEAAP